jgi:hypothetical protein
VEERGGEGLARTLRRHALPIRKLVLDVAKPRDEPLHHERRADGMREARVIGARVRVRSEPKLSHATKALHFGRFKETDDDFLLGRLERDEPMHWIA